MSGRPDASDRQRAAPPVAGAQPAVCYCFDVSEADIRAHFDQPGATYDSLIESTGIASKCTACRLDLDLILESVHQSKPARPTMAAEGPAEGRGLLRRPQDLSDAGFVVNRDGITTVLRVDNKGLLFEDRSWVVDYDYVLRLFAPNGRVVFRDSGRLVVDSALLFDFSEIDKCPDEGWFLLSLYPCGRGLIGTTRPQLILEGPDWTSSVHTQWLAMSCRFKAALLRSEGAKTNSMVSLINAARATTKVTIELSAPEQDYLASRDVNLPPYGSRLVEIDAAFDDLLPQANIAVAVHSDRPVSKHLIICHADGSWSQNHFPNTK